MPLNKNLSTTAENMNLNVNFKILTGEFKKIDSNKMFLFWIFDVGVVIGVLIFIL